LALRPPSDQTAVSKLTDRDAAQQDGFLREVDEALREEQFVAMIKRWALPGGIALGVGLAALAGYMWWDNSTRDAAAARSERVAMAFDKLDGGQLDAAASDLAALAKDSTDGTRAVALMSTAAIAMQQGKADEAAKQFAAIAADASLPKPYRDLATLREVAVRFDGMKPEEVIAQLKPLAVPGNPWFGSAGELVAMAYLDMGKPDLAGALLAQVGQDKSVPDEIRSRARMVAGGLGYDGGVDELPKDAPDEAGAAPAKGTAPAPAASAPAKQ